MDSEMFQQLEGYTPTPTKVTPVVSADRCPHCNASLKMYWHKITPILVKSLGQAYKVVSKNHYNRFTKKDLFFSHSAYGNFQKLRFHGLIARFKVDGKWKKGEWLITRRGSQFLKGEIGIPARVQTFRNRVVDHDVKLLTYKEVLGTEPYVETEFDWGTFDVEDHE